jgi:hypothetical protein
MIIEMNYLMFGLGLGNQMGDEGASEIALHLKGSPLTQLDLSGTISIEIILF